MVEKEREPLDSDDLAARLKQLLDEVGHGDWLTPMAEQYYSLARGAIEQAQRFATLAHYNRMQGR